MTGAMNSSTMPVNTAKKRMEPTLRTFIRATAGNRENWRAVTSWASPKMWICDTTAMTAAVQVATADRMARNTTSFTVNA